MVTRIFRPAVVYRPHAEKPGSYPGGKVAGAQSWPLTSIQCHS